jgi:hypothetical protein
MMTKQNDAVALTDEQLDAVAGAGRDERQRRRAMRRMIRAAEKLGRGTVQDPYFCFGSNPDLIAGTDYWDDGTGDPTQVN